MSSELFKNIKVGPAGWSYEDWKGIVYPPFRGYFNQLAYLVTFFDTIEINNTFYSLPSPRVTRGWIRGTEVNPHFMFTAKLFRNFTHERGALTEKDERDFKYGIEPLMTSQRLGALLIQFPYSFHCTKENLDVLRGLARRFKGYPLILEIRHSSWDKPYVYEFLRDEAIGFCNIDQPQASRSIGLTNMVTSDIGYIRLHGRNIKDWFRQGAGRDARYNYLYNDQELEEISESVKGIAEACKQVYVITNNHYRGQAVCNALQLRMRFEHGEVAVPETMKEHYPALRTQEAS